MSTVQNRSQARNSNPQRGGQSSLGLFGVTDRCHAERASSLTQSAARAIYGNARPAFAAASRALRAERECQPKPPTCRFAPGEALPVLKTPRALAALAALPPSDCQNTLRSPGFNEEAEAEYEAHLAEVAEARARQLDEEADRYACSFAGAGYTEYLMACEG